MKQTEHAPLAGSAANAVNAPDAGIAANAPNAPRAASKASLYFRATRPFSFPASIVPVLVGAMLVVQNGAEGRWALLPLTLLGMVILHAATNMVSDYFDYRHGVDRPGTMGSSGVIVEGLLPPRSVLTAGLICFAVGSGIGAVLAVLCGWPVVLLGAVGVLGGFFYSGRPLGYKYVAMGDLGVFLLMGVLPVMGTYFVLTGTFTWALLWVSLPVGCLVTAILCGNNVRDIFHDRQAHVRTLESVLGFRGAKALYCGLVVGAYAAVVAMVASGVLTAWALAVFLAAWPAVRNVSAIVAARADRTTEIALIDVSTAKHHLLFGLLLAAAMATAGLV